MPEKRVNLHQVWKEDHHSIVGKIERVIQISQEEEQSRNDIQRRTPLIQSIQQFQETEKNNRTGVEISVEGTRLTIHTRSPITKCKYFIETQNLSRLIELTR